MSTPSVSETGNGKTNPFLMNLFVHSCSNDVIQYGFKYPFVYTWQRHLLPFQMGQGDHVEDGADLPGRARPHYTYSRKSTLKRNKGSVSGLEFTDNEDEDSNSKLVCCDLLVLFVVFKKIVLSRRV